MDKYHFSGYATKVNLKCTDGRTILKDAFKDCDGKKVPLVWQHLHDSPINVLGHALLENRDDGVYAYAFCNDTQAGENARRLVLHGDITSFSIYANQLIQKGTDVVHGMIREVSLVMTGANPGAKIDYINIEHADGSVTTSEDEAVIVFGEEKFDIPQPEKVEEIKHEESKEKKEEKVVDPKKDEVIHAAMADELSGDPTVEEIFNTLNEQQKNVVYAMIAEAVDSSAQQSDEDENNLTHEGDGKVMKHNVFDGSDEEVAQPRQYLTKEQLGTLFLEAKKVGSLKKAILAHADEYGIENIDYLFPDARTITSDPAFISRRMEWVNVVMGQTYHTPFSRIKSLAADITADEARAKGYVKGSLKKDEIISLLRRVTTPTTVYKKQKLDRDDIVDIVDLDVVAWLKSEMRVMLDEELARAMLIGDGREAEDEDKIADGSGNVGIRPIYTDDDMYAYHVQVAADHETDDVIDDIIRARKNYKGSGSPAMFCTTDFLADMLLLKDTTGRRIFASKGDLEATLMVSQIIDVDPMDGLTRESDDEVPVTLELLAIIVNLKDYKVGADNGGEVNMFEDFDIDYNQEKYLLESRCSGALVLPHSALVIEQIVEEPAQ